MLTVDARRVPPAQDEAAHAATAKLPGDGPGVRRLARRAAGAYLWSMRLWTVMLLAFALLAPAVVQAQGERSYDIMRPEPGRPDELPTPWLPPKCKSPRGSHNRVEPIPQQRPRYVAPRTPPPLVVPQTGQVVPQSPVLSPSGPHGMETFQDRATRCVGQSSAAGAGSPGAYVGTCVNQ